MPRLIRASSLRERDRTPPRARESTEHPGWRTALQLSNLGLPMSTLQRIEGWAFENTLNAHVIDVRVGTKSTIVTMRGDCFFCRDEQENPVQHSSNHWVLIQTPGYSTTRIRCHSSGMVLNKQLPFSFLARASDVQQA